MPIKDYKKGREWKEITLKVTIVSISTEIIKLERFNEKKLRKYVKSLNSGFSEIFKSFFPLHAYGNIIICDSMLANGIGIFFFIFTENNIVTKIKKSTKIYIV